MKQSINNSVKYMVEVSFSKLPDEGKAEYFDNAADATIAFAAAIKDNGGYTKEQLTKEADLYMYPDGEVAFSDRDNVEPDFTDIYFVKVTLDDDGEIEDEEELNSVRLFNETPII